ncbi:MAG: hypothetical protein L0H64_15335 [Pseudonocardia sp.]|nr:hypothetical protein [Pseudonocardia sp.]
MPWAPDYVGVEDLKDYIRVPDTADDAVLARAVSTASRAVDRTAHRQFGNVAVPEAREYTARFGRRSGWVAGLDDVADSTGLLVALDTTGDGTYPTTVDPVDYQLLPRNAAQHGRPWEALGIRGAAAAQVTGREGEVRVTALFGWSTVPVAVAQATLLQASRLAARRDSPFGVAGSPDAGTELRLLARVDPDVAVALEPYRRRIWTR